MCAQRKALKTMTRTANKKAKRPWQNWTLVNSQNATRPNFAPFARQTAVKELRLGSGVVSLCPPLLASTIFT